VVTLGGVPATPGDGGAADSTASRLTEGATLYPTEPLAVRGSSGRREAQSAQSVRLSAHYGAWGQSAVAMVIREG
jgi:hypothetical protein